MQRKPTKNTRGPNAEERRFARRTKESACVVCENPGPSIVDHVYGATFKHNKVLIGHWFLLPLCTTCDKVKTIDGNAAFKRLSHPYNFTDLWFKHVTDSGFDVPIEVENSILDWGR